MDDYTKIKLGNGAFGIAYLAVNKKTNEECALKFTNHIQIYR